MARRLAAVVVGAGVEVAHPDGAHGTVVGTFRHGFYVQINGTSYAVAGPAVAPGPIHLIVEHRPVYVPEGLAVWRDGRRLRTTEWEIDLERAATFTPLMPGPAMVRDAVQRLELMCDGLEVPRDLHSRWDVVRGAVGAGDLHRARLLLEGRGGGLTPTGDDVLAGVLLVHSWLRADRDEMVRIAASAATTNLSRSFLVWAARGQSVAPVHDVVVKAALDDEEGFDAAVARVAAIGGSSGTALLWGIGLAATTSPAVTRAGEAVAPPARSWP